MMHRTPECHHAMEAASQVCYRPVFYVYYHTCAKDSASRP